MRHEGTVLDMDPGVHMSPYMHDRSVPIIFLGAKVTAGVSDSPAHTTDVAPTLARLAGVPLPAHLDGHARLRP
ncbi:MAG TPA: hypothetical protein VHE78_12695 [Gemmatimonadaceae bacterium]|nr:hypothetical protein [Gemmatimonadaceae bacterium]